MKLFSKFLLPLLLFGGFFIGNFKANAEETIDREKKQSEATNYNQSKSRIYIFRKSSQLVLGGVSASIGGRKLASLAKREFDIFDYKPGEVTVEVAQNLNFELCKVKINIEPLRDNYLLIRDRNFSVARTIFDQTLFGLAANLVERTSSGDCSGKNEIVEISKEEADKEYKDFIYSPVEKIVDGEFSKSKICTDQNKGVQTNSCDITYDSISKVRLTKYVSDSSVIGYIPPPTTMVSCKIGDNPEIDLEVDACLKVKGMIKNQDSLLCALGKNAPIKLIPELCLSGGGRVVRQ